MVAESTLKIVKSESFSLELMESIVDWKKDETATHVVDKYLSLLIVKGIKEYYSWIEAASSLE